jgi:hypothetical protein
VLAAWRDPRIRGSLAVGAGSAAEALQAASAAATPRDSPTLPQEGGPPGRRAGLRFSWLGLTAIVVVVAIVGAAYALASGLPHGSSSSSAVTLATEGSFDGLSGGQYDDIALVVHTPALLNGTVRAGWAPVVIYVMTPEQFENLSRTGLVSGYTWASPAIPGLTFYGLNVTVSVGEWNLVFLNPSVLNDTGVDFWTALTETPT